MQFFFTVIIGLMLGYGALVFGASATKPGKGVFNRCGNLLISLALTGLLMYLTFISAGREESVVVWDAFGMSTKLTRETGNGLYRLYAFTPLLSFIPLGLGLCIGTLIHRSRSGAVPHSADH